jgi:hypothetical protein
VDDSGKERWVVGVVSRVFIDKSIVEITIKVECESSECSSPLTTASDDSDVEEVVVDDGDDAEVVIAKYDLDGEGRDYSIFTNIC